MPTGRSVTIAAGPAGMTTNSRNVVAKMMNGGSLNNVLSALSGMMSSFCSHLPTSATSCSVPCGPASMGPKRDCMKEMSLKRKR